MPIEPIADPIALFREWFSEALACREMAEPTAMTLATVNEDGMPWARVVLLKDVDERGFAFYTNTSSAKGRQLAANPKAALCFYWMPLGKQVRVRGVVERVTDDESDTYFATRSRESRIGAWASLQSDTLASPEELHARYADLTKEFEGRDVPRPPNWSGYRVVPQAIEFWLRGEHRLHDRVLYERDDDGGWRWRRLYP